MRRSFLLGIMSLLVAVNMSAAYNLTASKVTIQDLTINDNVNFFVTVEAHTSSGEYEVDFDIFPTQHSAIGSFSASDHTISYVNSRVHKTKANGSAVDMWYYANEDNAISLTIVKKDETTCTLSGSIQATRNGTTYTYDIAAFDFTYSEEGIEPGEEKDPYRFEPTEASTLSLNGDAVSIRERDGWLEINLFEQANETYNSATLRLLTNAYEIPAGTYSINASGASGSLTASKGYLGLQNDDPCLVAIHEGHEWGQYTPYYLVSGSIEVSYNAKTDSIFFSGTAQSYNGSTIQLRAKGANPLYDPYNQPREPENVVLSIDTLRVTYRSDKSDEAQHLHYYTFHFTQALDYPEVLFDIILPTPMALTAGTYTLADGQLEGLALFQNQTDYNTFFYGGVPYDFEVAELTLTETGNGVWNYDMFISDAIGSEYRFNLTQAPHIILYPTQDDTDPKEVPFQAESQTTVTQSFALDAMVWDDKTVSKDGVLDIHMTSLQPNNEGLYPYVHLGMYTNVSHPEAGTYPINGSEANGSFSASLGRYGEVIIPCYVMIVDETGLAYAIWYLTEGDIRLSYDEAGEPIVSGECTSHYGSSIRFTYSPKGQGIENVQRDNVQGTKVMENGVLYIMYKGTKYNVQGKKM